MTELLTGICIFALLGLLYLQGKELTNQQAQIEQLRETIVDYMENMNKFVSAQNDANEAVINTLDLDAQQYKLMYNAVLALGKHVEILDSQMKGT